MQPHSIVAGLTTALWILIELIQFGYMAYLYWRNQQNDINRNNHRARSATTCA